jgi:hypothetical protein
MHKLDVNINKLNKKIIIFNIPNGYFYTQIEPILIKPNKIKTYSLEFQQ